MAKKDPTDLSVEEKLKTLYQLQTTLSGIDEKRALRGELPLEVQDLEDESAGLMTRVEKSQNEIAEFQALEIELCNQKIPEAQVRMEERNHDMEQTKALIEDRRVALNEKKEELDEIMDETRTEEEKLKERARELEVKIEPRLLASFKRIRKNARNGLGIVYVQRDACGGCFNKIPPQRQLDIKMHKKIIVCEYCGRIMIDPELAGVKIEAPTDDKPKRKRSIRRKKDEDDDVMEA